MVENSRYLTMSQKCVGTFGSVNHFNFRLFQLGSFI